MKVLQRAVGSGGGLARRTGVLCAGAGSGGAGRQCSQVGVKKTPRDGWVRLLGGRTPAR